MFIYFIQTFEQKVAVIDPANNQVIELSVLYSWSGCKEVTKNGQQIYRCEGGRKFRSTRERWWFIAVSRCNQPANTPQGINLTYTLHMTNSPDDDDILHYEFSADEFYILPTNIAFAGIYVVICLFSIISAYILRSRQLFHATYKLYMGALGLWIGSLIFLSIAYGVYSSSGYEQFGLEIVGRILASLSTLVFLLMLILVGKGYTITRGKLTNASTIKIGVFFTLYTLAYATLFIYEAEVFDPAEVLYTYESPPGYGLIALRLIGWGWFCYSVFFTLKHYKSKQMFYIPLFIFYTIWFWASPIIVLIAMFGMDQWMREKTVNGVDLFVALCGHVFFLILTRPSAANKNFPYHVRTTQIGSLMGAPSSSSSELDSFGQYPYAVDDDSPSTSETGPDLTGLFVVSTARKEKNDRSEGAKAILSRNSKAREAGFQEDEEDTGMPSVRMVSSQHPFEAVDEEPSSPATGSVPPPSYEALFLVGGNSRRGAF